MCILSYVCMFGAIISIISMEKNLMKGIICSVVFLLVLAICAVKGTLDEIREEKDEAWKRDRERIKNR